MSEARAFWVPAPGRGEIRAQRLRSAEPGELLIRALASGISRGTETLVFRGVKCHVASGSECAAHFQEGEFPGPVKYGYAVAGVVEERVPPDAAVVASFAFILHQDRFIVPHDASCPSSGRRARPSCNSGRQHGNRCQRVMGCNAGSGRPNCGHRRRRRRHPGSGARRPIARRRGRIDRHRPAPRRARSGIRLQFRGAAARARRSRLW